MIWPDDLKDQILSSAAHASSRMLSEKLTTNPKPNLTVIGISEESVAREGNFPAGVKHI